MTAWEKCILWSRTLYVGKYSSENFSLFPKITCLRKSTSGGAVEYSLSIISLLLWPRNLNSYMFYLLLGALQKQGVSGVWIHELHPLVQLMCFILGASCMTTYKINYNPNVKAAVMLWRWWCETRTVRKTCSFRDYERTSWLCGSILWKYTGYTDDD